MSSRKERSGRTTMFEDDVTFKLYAAAEEDDEQDLDAEDAEFTEDEEEEESFSGGDDLTLDDADYEGPGRTTTHVEEVEVFAMPARGSEPYEPPTRMGSDAVGAPVRRAALKKAIKKALVKRAIKKAIVKKAIKKAVVKKAVKKAIVKKAVK